MAEQSKSAGSVVLRVLAILIIVILSVVLALNLYVRIRYAHFYDVAKQAFPIPGVSSGFVSQDIDYIEEDDAWLFCGYVDEVQPSPLYLMDSAGTATKFFVDLPDGSVYNGHGAGVTSDERFVFLTTDSGYVAMNRNDVMNVEEGDHVKALGEVFVDFEPAFLNIEKDVLYIGNYYAPDSYETPASHRITTPDGTLNPAIMYAYPTDATKPYGFSDIPERVYSIPGRCQGMCILGNDTLVLSTSGGVSTSKLFSYDLTQVHVDGTFLVNGHDVSLYTLDGRSLINTLEAPPMGEGIENVNNLVYISEEAASNRYFFGKLYGAGYVYAIQMT